MNARGIVLLVVMAVSMPALALESRTEVGVEQWLFEAPGAQGQSRQDTSARAQLELWQRFNDNKDTVTTRAFYRVDGEDDRRTHGDLREASWIHVGSDYEFRGGVRQVFWGVTEGEHLVDIINQTDLVENVDGKQKLGQPMLNLSLERETQTLDLFLLPGSRQRTFPGANGRLRLPWVVDSSLASYQSSREDHHVDLAARWQLNTSALRLGVSGFSGTAREPALRPVVDTSQIVFSGMYPVGFRPGYQPTLAPYYPLINQIGLDAQVTQGDLLWKLEAIERNGGARNYHASDAGLEYTQVGAFGSTVDVGWLAEYLFDSRGEQATTPFEHDALIGWRFAFNDAASSELLTSLIVDSKTHERLLSIELHHRLSESLRLDLESRIFAHEPPPQTAFEALLTPDFTNKLRPYARDDFIRLELTWFY